MDFRSRSSPRFSTRCSVVDQRATLSFPTVLTKDEKLACFITLGSCLLAFLFPFPAIKYILGGILGLTFLCLSLKHFYLAVSIFTFLLPLQALLPKGSILIRGTNLETIFIIFFLLLGLSIKR